MSLTLFWLEAKLEESYVMLVTTVTHSPKKSWAGVFEAAIAFTVSQFQPGIQSFSLESVI